MTMRVILRSHWTITDPERLHVLARTFASSEPHM
jgi:hypothetical protein